MNPTERREVLRLEEAIERQRYERWARERERERAVEGAMLRELFLFGRVSEPRT